MSTRIGFLVHPIKASFILCKLFFFAIICLFNINTQNIANTLHAKSVIKFLPQNKYVLNAFFQDKKLNDSKKLALLVGIDKYKNVGNLNGCVNDVLLIKKMLIEKFGFLEKNIILLKNENATRANIINNFQSNLIEKANPDDIVLFHMSSHGSQQKEFIRGEEIDGLDEIVVPYDFSYTGISGISDNEINGLLYLLTNKTKNVTFILDACNSGGATRALGFTKRQLDKPDTLRPSPKPGKYAITDEISQNGSMRSISGIGRNKANYVFISGCRSDELSNEHKMPNGQVNGLLTYYLEKEIRKSPAGKLTYNDIMDNVKSSVSEEFHDQHPQLEGANTNSLVFGDPITQIENYIRINPGMNSQLVKVAGGTIIGLILGSQFEVYSPTARQFKLPEKPIAVIEITKVGALTSEAKIISGQVTYQNSRAVETLHNYGDRLLNVSFTGSWDNNILSSCKTQVKRLPFSTSDGPVHLVLRSNKDKIMLTFPDDTTNVLKTYHIDNELNKSILEDLNNWAKWFDVLSLENPRSQIRGVNFSLVKKKGLIPVPFPDNFFKAGEEFEIEINNQTDKALFCHLIDLKDDGTIGIYDLSDFPQSHFDKQIDAPKQNEAIPPKHKWTGRIIATIATGNQDRDVLKLFATTNSEIPLNFFKSASDHSDTKDLSDFKLKLRGRDLRPASTDDKQVGLDEWVTTQRYILTKK